jgi:hypothetical protein
MGNLPFRLYTATPIELARSYSVSSSVEHQSPHEVEPGGLGTVSFAAEPCTGAATRPRPDLRYLHGGEVEAVVTANGVGVVSHAGTVLLSELADRFGLPVALSEAMQRRCIRRGAAPVAMIRVGCWRIGPWHWPTRPRRSPTDARGPTRNYSCLALTACPSNERGPSD